MTQRYGPLLVGNHTVATASPVNTGTASRDHCSKQDYK